MKQQPLRLVLALVTVIGVRPLLAENHATLFDCSDWCAEGWTACCIAGDGKSACCVTQGNCCISYATGCGTAQC
jgi:hypothetical protein